MKKIIEEDETLADKIQKKKEKKKKLIIKTEQKITKETQKKKAEYATITQSDAELTQSLTQITFTDESDTGVDVPRGSRKGSVKKPVVPLEDFTTHTQYYSWKFLILNVGNKSQKERKLLPKIFGLCSFRQMSFDRFYWNLL